ncbi:mannitol-1-phosphate 5-dehydrogenase [Buchnera aphidicola]|uniref:Mannitol-1-phosphate 5-dehydrogenase n=1 Tax=Buchnera aphidicola (Artemisaphis artemisicola) TaxID=1241836 RepID=A0A4D6XTP0_9GAMM|nr:mannitol-1-phosphate 5-dehydrogenase [Buchnera aphidicola]QCI16215.1 mannitol-1-phosphate 5-dehydrogenase [Buchnera aphidicola (Artemisaphis artemisicola)]
MKVLHFGAGNIGRGFIGRILSESGYDVIFSDIDQNLINIINSNQQYTVKIVGNHQEKIINVRKVSAVHFHDLKIMKIISSVKLITTAVGANALHVVALILAQGILLKIKNGSITPLNIIACENKVQASSFLKKEILKKLSPIYHDYLNKYVGFIDCSIDTIIPLVHFKNNKDVLFLLAEDFKEWIVDVNQFKGDLPKIIDIKYSDNLKSFIERKLFTLNTGHAIAAYLGLMKNYNSIQESMLDEEIRLVVKSAMEESGLVLIKRYNFNKNEHANYINKIFSRFDNPFLSDSLKRIARNPLQKLGNKERLIGPLLGSIQYNLPYFNLSKGIAAAFHYHNPQDLESMKISSFVKDKGIENAIIKICNLSKNSPELYSIILEYINFFNKKK